MSLVLVKKIPKQEEHSLQRLQCLLWLKTWYFLNAEVWDDHKIYDTCPQDIDMFFKLFVTTKIIPCLNWTDMKQAFPNNSLFLRLVFKDKQVKETTVDWYLSYTKENTRVDWLLL